MAAQSNQIGYAASIPTSNGQFYQYGDIMINNAPAVGAPYGWVMVTSGGSYTGTWLPIVSSPTQTATYTATTGTLSNGQALILLNPVTSGNYSLPEASTNMAGFRTTIKVISNSTVTLTPLATDVYDTAAITLTQNQVVNLVSNNSTVWYKAA